jgi:hypothetical protein
MNKYFGLFNGKFGAACAHMVFLKNIIVSPSQRKHAFRWLMSLRRYYLLDARMPWITFDAIDYLKVHLVPKARVFEYGSGGSTLFWLNHCEECVSIEHNPDWYKLMHPRIKEMDKIDYRLVLPDPAEDKEALDTSDPNQYLSKDSLSIGYDFRNYVCQIDAFPDYYFDVVSIDGRARPSCIKHSVTKVNVGGILILDNAERAYYFSKIKGFLKNFDKKEFFGVGPSVASMWKTDIYLRIR